MIDSVSPPYIPQGKPQWSLSSFQKLLVAFFGVLFMLVPPVGAAVLGLWYVGTRSSTTSVNVILGKKPFVKQADGGTFSSARELVETLEQVGIPCYDPRYFTNTFGDDAVECGTKVSIVTFVVAKRDITEFRESIRSEQAFKTMTSRVLVGRNWILITSCDYKYGNKVKEVIGGEHLYQGPFFIPPNCPHRGISTETMEDPDHQEADARHAVVGRHTGRGERAVQGLKFGN